MLLPIDFLPQLLDRTIDVLLEIDLIVANVKQPLHNGGELVLHGKAEPCVLPEPRNQHSDDRDGERVERDDGPGPQTELLVVVDAGSEEQRQLEEREDLLGEEGLQDEGGERERVESPQEDGVSEGGVAFDNGSGGIIEETHEEEDEERLQAEQNEHETLGLEALEDLRDQVVDAQQQRHAHETVAERGEQGEDQQRPQRGDGVEKDADGGAGEAERQDLRQLEGARAHLREEVGGEEESVVVTVVFGGATGAGDVA